MIVLATLVNALVVSRLEYSNAVLHRVKPVMATSRFDYFVPVMAAFVGATN